MKKNVTILLLLSLLLSSCFSTRYVSNEPMLRRDFDRASVDDVEFEFGNPDDVEELRNGYAYTYYYDGYVMKNKRTKVGQFTRFSFDDNDYVRNIQSTKTVKKKQFSAGGTVVTCLFFLVILPAAMVGIAAAESE